MESRNGLGSVVQSRSDHNWLSVFASRNRGAFVGFIPWTASWDEYDASGWLRPQRFLSRPVCYMPPLLCGWPGICARSTGLLLSREMLMFGSGGQTPGALSPVDSFHRSDLSVGRARVLSRYSFADEMVVFTRVNLQSRLDAAVMASTLREGTLTSGQPES